LQTHRWRELDSKFQFLGDGALPEDVVIAAALEPGVATRTLAIEVVPSDMMILDIGPRTVTRLGALLKEAHALVWNGPLGAFETPPFDRGTVAVAKKVAELTRAGKLLSVAGGGDTVAALDAAGVAGQLSYVSSAGGAFLEWLEGRKLPGVAALTSVDRERPRSICADAAGGGAILSRMRSPMTSRSNCAKDSNTLRVNRPIEVVVLNCCVTETNEAPLASRISTILAKSASERVSRSIL
jgi:hypothetical protein